MPGGFCHELFIRSSCLRRCHPKKGNSYLTIGENSPQHKIARAFRWIVSGNAQLVLKNTKVLEKKGLKASLNLNGREAVVKLGDKKTARKIGKVYLLPLKNKKDFSTDSIPVSDDLSGSSLSNLLEVLIPIISTDGNELEILPTATQMDETLTPESEYVEVYKTYPYTPCLLPYRSINSIDYDIALKGIKVQRSFCALPQGQQPQTVCGQSDVFHRVHSIKKIYLSLAQQAGYLEVKKLPFQLTEQTCPGYDTVEMVGYITNINCKPITQTIANLDYYLARKGLVVLSASCGYEAASGYPSCGRELRTYRLVKIYSAQRYFAQFLGLLPRAVYDGKVAFGARCGADMSM